MRRSRPAAWTAAGRVFAFEATGRVGEALAAHLEVAGCGYVIVTGPAFAEPVQVIPLSRSAPP